jgi:hypothetical protein
VWACHAFFLGRLGGEAFEDRPWLGLLLALGLAVAVTVLTEVARRARRWHASARDRRPRPPPGRRHQADAAHAACRPDREATLERAQEGT